ncbi:MAG TPA: hypothetical protein VFC07_08110 [Verrucomicrobiae bacterium]|nr:hypothetical protein [Verrucomicrobiae bacterium]
MSRSIRARIPKCIFAAIIMAAFIFVPSGSAAPGLSEATRRARTFLLDLRDPDLGLLPEYRGANVYWLFHDNYLAAKVLSASHPQIARSIMAAIHREGVYKSGKIEIIFGETKNPLPFRQYQLLDVRRAASKVIRTEKVTDKLLDGWENYADLLLLACIAETNQPAARQHWDAAIRLWDGKGFLDAAARDGQRYATYKLGLALLASQHLTPSAKPPPGLLDRLLALQDASGGWITDYDATGKKIGLANVETTCLSILGIEAFSARKQLSSK